MMLQALFRRVGCAVTLMADHNPLEVNCLQAMLCLPCNAEHLANVEGDQV